MPDEEIRPDEEPEVEGHGVAGGVAGRKDKEEGVAGGVAGAREDEDSDDVEAHMFGEGGVSPGGVSPGGVSPGGVSPG